MAVQTPMDVSGPVARIYREILYEEMGYVFVDGLSFRVMDDRRQLFRPRRVYARPFTKQEHRRYVWATRRRRFKTFFTGPYREARRRLSNAWDAIKGRDDYGDYW